MENFNMMRFSQILRSDINVENITNFITELDNEYLFFVNGFAFLDELLESKLYKELPLEDQLQLFSILDVYGARYSDNIYKLAFWYPKEIQDCVKILPIEYSKRHISDIENY